MADQTTNRRINIYIESGAAQKEFDKLDAKAKAFTQELATTTDKGRIKQIQKELAALAGPLDVARKKLSGELAPSMKELQKTVTELGNRMKRMSTTDADFSNVLRQYSQAKAQLSQVRDEVKRVEEAHQAMGNTNPFAKVLDFAKGAFLGGALLNIVQGAFGGITDFIKGSFDEAFQADEAGARLKATLDNLGRSDAFDRITAKADEMANKFKYLDNDDVVGVFNKLIDYGKLTEKQMNDLLPVIIDFAAKQRISVEEATTAIVGGLEGQGKALKQYGINVKEGKDETERLAMIMGTLKEKVTGAAEAFSQTAAGGVAETRQEFKNLQEDIGTGLLPALNKVLTVIRDGITGIRYLFGQVKNKAGQEDDRQDQAQINHTADAYYEKAKQLIQNKRASLELLISQNEKIVKDRVAKGLDQLPESAKQGFFDKLFNGEKFDRGDRGAYYETQARKLVLERLKADQNPNKTLGISGDEVDKEAEAAAKKAAAKRDAEAKKILEDHRRLAEELKKLRAQLTVANESEMDRELAAVAIKYGEMAKLAHGNGELLKQLENQLQDEMLAIMVKHGRKQTEEFKKQSEQERQAREQEHQKQVQQAQQHAIRMGQELAKAQNALGRDRVAGIELELLRAHGVQKLALNKRLLEEKMNQELANENLTQKERELIVEQYRLKSQEAERNHWQNVAGIMLEFVGSALQVLDQFGQAQTARENAGLEHDRAINEKKKGNYKRQLDNKQITQQEYDRKVAELDKQQEKKEHEAKVKQFKRQQRTAIANALISGAQAAVKTLSEWGMPFAIPFLALTAASTVASVATITAQKPPEMARGGLLDGPSHRSKTRGMPVINPTTGRTQALLEGGEAITNKRTMQDRGTYSLTGTPSQIISTLNALHGGVAWDAPVQLVPAWKTRPVMPINFDTITRSFRTVRLFENGGVFDDGNGGKGAAPAAGNPAFDPAILVALATVVGNLDDTIRSGINANLSLSHFENQQARRQAIIDAGTMKA